MSKHIAELLKKEASRLRKKLAEDQALIDSESPVGKYCRLLGEVRELLDQKPHDDDKILALCKEAKPLEGNLVKLDQAHRVKVDQAWKRKIDLESALREVTTKLYFEERK